MVKQECMEVAETGENWKTEWKEKKKQAFNHMELSFCPLSQNEGFARVAVASFMTQLDPTLEEVEDVKTTVSEAVTNAVIHGYGGADTDQQKQKPVALEAFLEERSLYIKITDWGVGISDIKQAMEPLYTSKPELERSGMGFAFMEAFMDQLYVESKPGIGTSVYMSKQIGGQ